MKALIIRVRCGNNRPHVHVIATDTDDKRAAACVISSALTSAPSRMGVDDPDKEMEVIKSMALSIGENIESAVDKLLNQ